MKERQRWQVLPLSDSCIICGNFAPQRSVSLSLLDVQRLARQEARFSGRNPRQVGAPRNLPQLRSWGCDSPDYVVDGKTVAGSQPNGFVVCHLPPGRHEVSVSNLPFSNNFFGDGAESMTINLRPGIETYIAASPQMGVFTPGKITLKEVSETQGRADTASLHQIGATCG